MRVICEECNGKGKKRIEEFVGGVICNGFTNDNCEECNGRGFREYTIDFTNLRNLVKSLAKATSVGLPDLVNELDGYSRLAEISAAVIVLIDLEKLLFNEYIPGRVESIDELIEYAKMVNK